MKSWTFDRTLALAGCIAGAIALLLSWETNSIAREQVSAHVVVLSVDGYGASLTSLSSPPNAPSHLGFKCYQSIRLTNLGGAATAIISYDATIHYRQQTVGLSSSSKEALARTDAGFEPQVHEFTSIFSTEEGEQKLILPDAQDYQPTYALTFPYRIEPFTTLDVNPKLYLSIEGRTAWSADFPAPSSPEYKELQSGYDPLTIEYSLKLASGQVVTTPPIICLYVNKKP